MPKIIFRLPDGTQTVVHGAPTGSIMQAARDASIPGIPGECGGCISCGTCHVYVEEKWLARLAPMSADENALLDYTAAPRRPNSRLSCQIVLRPELDAIELEVPAAP
jgi:2Fe-2S ferredoxin